MKNYKYLLRKAKCSKRINGVKVKDIYSDYIPDVSRKIYRRYHYKGISDLCQLYSETKLYEFLDDDDVNFVVKAKMTKPEKIIYDDFEGDYYWRYFYKIYFSKDNGKTWDTIIYDVNNFSIYSPIKDKYDDTVDYSFEKTIDYKVMMSDSFDYWYSEVSELVRNNFSTYEKCKTHNEVVLDKVKKNNVDSLTSIFKDVDKPSFWQRIFNF